MSIKARASLLDTYRNGKIRQSRGAVFVEIMKKYAESKEIELGLH